MSADREAPLRRGLSSFSARVVRLVIDTSLVASGVLKRWKRRLSIRRRLLARAERRLAAARKADVHPREHLVVKVEVREDQVEYAERVIDRHGEGWGAERWYPKAHIVRGRDAGGFTGGGKKIVWHTTEGSSAAGAVGAYRASGSWPHLTVTFEGGRFKVFQHLPLTVAARALAHPSGPETNRANAIQIECVGFAVASEAWPAGYYVGLREVSRWIEESFGVPRRTSVQFRRGVERLGGEAFYTYSGHVGHCHVPGNDHWDPGDLRISEILG